MLSDVTWRKMPLDILTNETMTYIESQMPDGLGYAPFMFYQACLKRVDEDGIFDLEDGVIFARLMRVPSPSIVFMVAGLMAKRKMICHVSKDSNKCFLVDWEYPKGSEPRTMSERRAIVERQIAEQKARAAQETAFICQEESLYDFSEYDFFDGLDDKNVKNVDKNSLDDKNVKNVDKKNQTEREREREIRENRESTHTERESPRGREATTSAGCVEKPAPVVAESEEPLRLKDNQEIQSETKTEPEVNSESTLEIATSKKSKTPKKQSEKDLTGGNPEVEAVLEAFFSKTFGYDAKKGKKQVEKLAEKIKELETETVRADFLAAKMTTAFEKMHNSPGIWKDIPLTPTYMLKEGVWAHLLEYVGQILKKTKGSDKVLEKAEEAKKAFEAEREEIKQESDEEYKKYGISPTAPNRFALLMNAKKLEEQQIRGGIF